MANGLKTLPRNIHHLNGFAQVAQARGDHETAIMRYAAAREIHPNEIEGYIFAADSLTILGRLQEAETLAEQGMRRSPEDVRGFLTHARIALKRGDWASALQRWQVVIDRFDHQLGYIGAAQVLMRFERLDEAEVLLTQASIRFPTDSGPPTELARLGQRRGDVELAAARWKALAHRFPATLHCIYDAAQSLEAIGRVAESEQILRLASENLPFEVRPPTELARLLSRQEKFQASTDVWAAIRRDFPNNEEAYLAGTETLRLAGRLEAADVLREEHRIRFRSS
jgi:tetratricopeptide (TPR) repeat protein